MGESRRARTLARAMAVNGNRLVRIGARGGLAARALVYLIIGFLVASLALGSTTQVSQAGALSIIGGIPSGNLALGVSTVALGALTIWQWTEAIWVRGATPRRTAFKRLIPAAKSVGYAVTGVITLAFAIGYRPGPRGPSSALTELLLTSPLGSLILFLVGAVVTTVGGVSIARASTGRFFEELDVGALSQKWRRVVRILGSVGYATKGVAFAIVGLLIVAGALFSDYSRIGGLESAVTFLGALTIGPVLLTLVAVGMFGNGCYLIVRAVRLPQPQPVTSASRK